MNVNRDVLDRLERLGLRHYVTGSAALAAYAEPRQTRDMDVVVDLGPAAYESRLRPAFEDAYLVNDPIRFPKMALGSVIHMTEIAKVDLIMRGPDPWAVSALERRRTVDQPDLGLAWLISPEDLLLAKLEWSGGVSELQLRDCRSLIRVMTDLDWAYVQRYARILGVAALLETIHGG